ncbi:ankyrin repeat [Fusarium heterosporum]|uniref:Ankyrin repeat n=1 Tax=Fusarium heterosporum TaxID=42747 RepID=A0A8H5TAI9_FUSHE|nr:ankyrin repeat [Fusarium heterosporum]
MLNTNHHSISQFPTADCENYVLMRTALQDLHSKVTSEEGSLLSNDQVAGKIVSKPASRLIQIESVVDSRQIQQFYKSDYKEYKASVKPPIKDTFSWFLQEPQYIIWLESPLSTLLWVSGDPGCGKTTLARFLVDSINQHLILGDHDFLVTYFFFDGNNFADQVDGTALLFALIHQLLRSNPALVAEKYLALDNTQSGLNLGKLCDIFRGIVSSPERKTSRIVCVVDAVDECEEGSMMKILRFLTSIIFDDSDNTNKGGWLKIVVTSRCNEKVSSFLPASQKVRLADHAESTARDIATFVRARCDQVQATTRCTDDMRRAIEK